MAIKKDFNLPESQEREYIRALVGFSKSLQSDVNKLLIPVIGSLKRGFEKESRGDSWGDDLDMIMSELLMIANQSIGFVVNRLPDRYEAISKFNNGQFKLVVKANTGLELPAIMPGAPRAVSLGVNVFRSEPFLKPLLENWVSENTTLIKSIPEKLHSDVAGIVRRGIANGSSVKTIQSEIKDRYPVTDARAKLIAQDQVLKANADLTRYRLQSVGVKEFIWNSVGDSRVRPAHVALEGKKFSWDKPHPTEGLPGSKIRCLPYHSNVEIAYGCSKLWRRTNTEKTTTLITVSGECVEATPKHPILTNRGWQAIQDINVGDYLFRTGDKSFYGLEGDIQDSKIQIGKLFDTIALYVCPSTSDGVTMFEFNGDAINSKVDTIDIGGFLPNEVDSSSLQRFCELFFTMADNTLAKTQFGVNSTLYLAISRLWNAPQGVISGACKLLALLNRETPHSDEIRLTTIANLCARFNQVSPNNIPATHILFGQGQFAATSNILSNQIINGKIFAIMRHANQFRNDVTRNAESLGQIVCADPKHRRNIENANFSSMLIKNATRVTQKLRGEFVFSHVYNLETMNEWYSTDNLIVHNCRCRAAPVFSDE